MHSTQVPPLRARAGWRGTAAQAFQGSEPVTWQAVRPSLSRYYKSRTDPTRTRAARRASRARKEARNVR